MSHLLSTAGPQRVGVGDGQRCRWWIYINGYKYMYPIPGIALLSPVGLVFPVKPGTKRRTKDLEESCRKGKRG